jgi:hypothetical protein
MRKLKQILKDDDETLFNDKCYLDFKLWAERVFGYQVKDFHLEWMNLVHKNRFTTFKAFRGSGKTTFLGVVYPLWLCWFHPGTHILFTASELKQATKILDEVKEQIEQNEFLNELMPPNPSTWRATELKMTNGSRIFCKAYTKHIKGVHVNYVFCDEIQDCQDRDIFNKAIAPTVNQKKGHIVAVGTPDNPADLLEELMNRAEYVSGIYPVITKPGTSRWPEKFPIDEIQRIRKRDGEHSFQTQYMMDSNVEQEGAVYPTDWVANCFDTHERFVERPTTEADSIFILGGDFAMSKGARADFDVYTVIEKIGGKAYLRWAERHKGLSKDAKIARLEELHRRFKLRRMILDPSGIGEAIIQELRMKALPVEAGEFHSRARNKLLVNLITMIQPNKDGESELIIPRDPECPLTLTFTNKLVEELISFRESKSPQTGVISLVSKGAHDDTVMSLALACKGASEQREFLDMVAI